MIPLPYYFVILCLLSAFICSVIRFSQHSFHLKIFSVVLGLALLTELSASFGLKYFREWFGLTNNLPIYNSFVLVQFIGYALYFRRIITYGWFQISSLLFISLFPVLWFVSIFYVFGIANWDSYIHVAGSAFTIISCAAYFYQLYAAQELVSLSRNTEFWIATGLTIFYTGNLPYTGMLNFLINNYMPVAVNLMFVLLVLNIVMYSIIFYAFVCQQMKITKSLSILPPSY